MLFLRKASFFPNTPFFIIWSEEDMDVEVGLKLFFNFSRLLSSRPKSFIGGELDETLGEATSK